MTKLYVGIDPGKNGGICFLNSQGQIEHISPMPTLKTFAGLMQSSAHLISHLVLEKSQPYTAQGVISMFTYGTHYGTLQGVLIANQISFDLIAPRTWQKTMIIPSNKTDPKAKALASANKVFHKKNNFWIPTSRHRKPHDGMIDSALIAEFCRKSNSTVLS